MFCPEYGVSFTAPKWIRTATATKISPQNVPIVEHQQCVNNCEPAKKTSFQTTVRITSLLNFVSPRFNFLGWSCKYLKRDLFWGECWYLERLCFSEGLGINAPPPPDLSRFQAKLPILPPPPPNHHRHPHHHRDHHHLHHLITFETFATLQEALYASVSSIPGRLVAPRPGAGIANNWVIFISCYWFFWWFQQKYRYPKIDHFEVEVVGFLCREIWKMSLILDNWYYDTESAKFYSKRVQVFRPGGFFTGRTSKWDRQRKSTFSLGGGACFFSMSVTSTFPKILQIFVHVVFCYWWDDFRS